MRFVITDTARADVLETMTYYRAPSQTADALSSVFYSGIRHLRKWPYTGHRRRDLTKEDVCFWFEAPYLFVIKIEDDVFFVVAVLHSSRNVARVLRQRFKVLRGGRVT